MSSLQNQRELTTRYMPLVRATARRLAARLPSHVSTEDLVGAGLLALVEVHGRYDASRCDSFEAYAVMRVRGAMLDQLRSTDHLSRDGRIMARKCRAASTKLRNMLGRVPTEEEVAFELGVSVERYRKIVAKTAGGTAVSIDDEDEALQLTGAGPLQDDQLVQARTNATLAAVLEGLPKRVREVLDLYYVQDMKLREIADRMGVSESRVCQIHTAALRKLRESASVRHLSPRTLPPPAGPLPCAA